MPQVGVKCVRGEIAHDDCRACALHPLHPCAYPADLLELMRGGTEPPASAHSPTRVQGCARQARLQDEYDYYIDVDFQYPMTRGHMIHALMEQAQYPGALAVIREQRLSAVIETANGLAQFSGKSDLVVIKEVRDGVAYAKVVDYKSKGKVGHDLVVADVSHQIQVNLYAYLVEKALTFENLPIVVDELEIVYCDMDKVRRFTSAGPLEARGKRIVGSRPAEYETLTLAPLKLKTTLHRWAERYLKHRIELREDSALAPVLPPEESWKCRRCPVFAICDRLAIENEEGRPGA